MAPAAAAGSAPWGSFLPAPSLPGAPDFAGLATWTASQWRDLREHLRRVGYDDDVIAASEGIAPTLPDLVRWPLVFDLLAERGAAGVLAALFTYDAAVPVAAAAAALGSHYAALCAAGVLVAAGERCQARLRLQTLSGLYFLADLPAAGSAAVMGPASTTAELARLGLPRSGLAPSGQAHRVLDLGCGAGSLALLAAARGCQAVGSDVNPRAAEIGALNAQLNDLPVRFCVSDGVAALTGERFDTVLCQPPYVIQAGDAVTFLHGGARGDELAVRLLAACRSVLAPGGTALFHFHSPGSSDLAARIETVCNEVTRPGSGEASHLALLIGGTMPADQQALGYALIAHPRGGAEYAAAAAAYRRRFVQSGVVASRLVLALLRAAAPGESGVQVQTAVRHLGGATRADCDAYLDGLRLAVGSDDALCRARLVPPAGSRLIVDADACEPGAAAATHLRLESGPGGFATKHDLSEAAAELLRVIAGAPHLAAAIADYASLCAVTPDEVASQVLAFARDSLASARLIPR